MSYCRLGADSDVYLYDSSDRIVCCWCRLGGGDFHAASYQEMFWHLVRHRSAGHRLPEGLLETFVELAEEDEGQGGARRGNDDHG